MKVLVANNHLEITGGSENFTYALLSELSQRKGFEVEYYCDPTRRGQIAMMIERNLNIQFKSHESYDLILANHTTMVEELRNCGFIIQTCHGVFPALEQPASGVDAYVAISQEVKDHLSECGFESYLIPNGIDCKRFKPLRKIAPQPQTILSLCQGEEANDLVKEACKELGLQYLHASKEQENIFYIEQTINQADIVVGIGRSIYDAMACGRCCISLDSRSYAVTKNGYAMIGDGYLNLENIDQSLLHNCTGRGTEMAFRSSLELISQIKRYNPKDGAALRKYALRNLNAKINLDKYINIYRCATDEEYAAWQRFKKNFLDLFRFNG